MNQTARQAGTRRPPEDSRPLPVWALGGTVLETHVMHWVPGYLSDDGQGRWELQAEGAYERGDPAPGIRNRFPRDADPGHLGIWAAGVLGYPVELELGWARLSSFTLRPLSFHAGREPVYQVTPAFPWEVD